MKLIIYIAFFLVTFSFAQNPPPKTSPKSKTSLPTLGKIQKTGKVTSLEDLIENFADYNGKKVTIDAQVSKTCKESLCWPTVKDGDLTAPLSFKNPKIVVTQGYQRKNVQLQGMLIEKNKDEAPQGLLFKFVATGLKVLD